MRKEILIVIISGVVLGILVAFGIFRANSALKDEPAGSIAEKLTVKNETPEPVKSDSTFTIARPEENDVITESSVAIAGITSPSSWITIMTEEDDYIIQTDTSGSFEQEVELQSGINQMSIHSFGQDGVEHNQILTVVQSSEFENSESGEE